MQELVTLVVIGNPTTCYGNKWISLNICFFRLLSSILSHLWKISYQKGCPYRYYLYCGSALYV